MTAKTIRERAWAKLGEGNWGRAVLAYGLYMLTGIVINTLLDRIGTATGGIEVTTLGDAIAKVSGLQLPQPLLDMQLKIPTPWWRVAGSIASVMFNGPLTAGWTLFAVALMRGDAHVMQVLSGFGRFLSTAWLALVMSVRIALWSLLLLVPGFVAMYAYRQAFFLKADHPEWSAGQILAESKRMMKGHKWRLACLDASFIGWLLLGILTLGLGYMFVMPYMNVANAAFYEDLLDRA